MVDLFTYANEYPNRPGHRGIDTSIEAAQKMAQSAKTIQDRVFKMLQLAPETGMTTEELCQMMRMVPKTIQPRVSELRAIGKIEDSGLRRKSASGVRVIVWKAL